MTANAEALLRAVLSTTARQTFTTDRLLEIVGGSGSAAKQRRAYNLCDGTVSQAEVARVLKLDRGNFSRTVARWIDAGIMFRLGDGRDGKLLHAYPLPSDIGQKRNGRNGKR